MLGSWRPLCAAGSGFTQELLAVLAQCQPLVAWPSPEHKRVGTHILFPRPQQPLVGGAEGRLLTWKQVCGAGPPHFVAGGRGTGTF